MASSKFGRGGGADEWSSKITDIMEEMRNRSFFDFRDTGAWQPATNVYETRDAYHICVELAGVAVDEVDVECADRNRVIIAGRRAQPRPEGLEGPLSVHVMEIDEGPFCREIDLPDPVDGAACAAKYEDGYLWLTVPKKVKQ